MTKYEASVVAAYTGYLIGSFSAMHGYVEKKLGRPVWTHQFPDLRDEIREKTKSDFVALFVGDEFVEIDLICPNCENRDSVHFNIDRTFPLCSAECSPTTRMIPANKF